MRMTEMLVLTRRAGESIIIGDNIVITVISTNGCYARIGIDAPSNVPILRDNAKNKQPSNSAEKIT
ncbi:carbon storage regulator [uncultured Gilliamella sp.]|uniref:carbon storage regulator n=1 Tax=uncultured Gilliamella sp. TaxID=1193505 RepID=UPI003424A262